MNSSASPGAHVTCCCILLFYFHTKRPGPQLEPGRDGWYGQTSSGSGLASPGHVGVFLERCVVKLLEELRMTSLPLGQPL